MYVYTYVHKSFYLSAWLPTCLYVCLLACTAYLSKDGPTRNLSIAGTFIKKWVATTVSAGATAAGAPIYPGNLYLYAYQAEQYTRTSRTRLSWFQLYGHT